MGIYADSLSDAEGLYARMREDAALAEAFETATTAIVAALKAGNTLLIVGNGGSAAEAQHFAAELTGHYKKERAPLPAVALTTDTSALTAIGNDYSYEEVFARQVEAVGRKGDVLVCLTTSGNSKNILVAIERAKARGMYTIGFGGKGGGAMKPLVDAAVIVPSDDTARIQEAHLLFIHGLSERIDEAFA